MKGEGKTSVNPAEASEAFPVWTRQGSSTQTSCPGCPGSTLGRLAGVDIHHLQAVLAAHGAAPVELALALRHPADTRGVVASAAAHHLAAVHAAGRLVANPAGRPWGPCKGKAAEVTRKSREWVLREDREHTKIGK